MYDLDALNKTVVSQAVEISILRERLAEAERAKELWCSLYNQQSNKKPADAANTDERING